MSNTRNVRRDKKGLFSGLTVAFAIAAIFIFIVGGTVAYFFASTKDIVNTFTPAKVECSVSESTTSGDGTLTKSSITVKNDGTIPAYIRVCLTTYWDTVENNDENSQHTILGLDAKLPDNFTLADNWFKHGNYYYYRMPIAPNAATGNLLGQNITLRVDGGNTQIIEVFAEAIQGAPAAAVEEAWGVKVDKDGNISAPTT